MSEIGSAGRAGEAPQGRLALLDLARGVAIAAMVVYHTAFDLSSNRLIPVDVVDSLPWTVFARLIAGSFLTIVGISLVLATRHGFDRWGYLKRLAFVAAGAAAVSAATYWFDASTFVYFGILHEIAVASILALPFLLAPSWLVAAAAIAVIAAPHVLTSPALDGPLFWVLGLAAEPRATVDYVPVLPWFGIVLAGIVVGRLLVRYGGHLWAIRPSGALARFTATAGRWSLVIYLLHQPLIVGIVSLAADVLPPNREIVRSNYTAECHAACLAEESAATDCTALCNCLFDGLWNTDLLTVRSYDDMTPAQTRRFQSLLGTCLPPPPLDQPPAN